MNIPITTIILAAGKGSRMKSIYPKWSHKIGNFNLLEHTIEKAIKIKSSEIITVLSQEDVEKVSKYNFPIKIAVQLGAKGTAHAVLASKDLVKNLTGVALILYCDTPLISVEILNKAIKKVQCGPYAVSIVAFKDNTPNNYGKLVIKGDEVLEIIETKNDPTIVNSDLCNSGIIAVNLDILWHLLYKVDNSNIDKEYYLTSIISIAKSMGYKCSYLLETNPDLARGVNTKTDLANLEKVFQNLKRQEFLNKGVTLIDPSSIFFSLDTKIGDNVVIHPFNVLSDKVVIKDNVTIESFSHIQGSIIKEGSTIGPFARLRNNTIIGKYVNIGNFVEVKETNIDNTVNVRHLSYIGNANIEEKTNIGAGVITCNYDGINKNSTNIGKNCFIGSNVSLVAPLNIGNKVTIGAGSVITKDVSSESLALERNRQIVVAGYWNKKHKQ